MVKNKALCRALGKTYIQIKKLAPINDVHFQAAISLSLISKPLEQKIVIHWWMTKLSQMKRQGQNHNC